MPCECKYCGDYFSGIAWFVKHLKKKHGIDILSDHLNFIPKVWNV